MDPDRHHTAKLHEKKYEKRGALQRLSPSGAIHGGDMRQLATSTIDEEATRHDHRELGGELGICLEAQQEAAVVTAIRGEANIELAELVKQYRTRPATSLTPMERFNMPDSVEHPFPMYAKQEMASWGVEDASMRSLDRRVELARIVESPPDRATQSIQPTDPPLYALHSDGMSERRDATTERILLQKEDVSAAGASGKET
ncbi:hypothetical protein LTR56_018317 [Elasticomyces elasticus]|nr:hypothetical protein LTR22_025913 [Elasticomyces elasticus]KAK3628962.1 hypothetical protein LTR56_018317 [Elasticomyces elasticus]KAK4909231.1 hypothetical protein LTR49_021983 [Elasticomyces elasticus]KAK5758860.1 hypothetical protein LTS12_010953 [Elasticomyces elasticus]